MNDLLSSGLWPRIRKLSKKSHKKSAAVAYVTDDTSVAFGDGDVLITDASDGAIKAGQTSASVLKAAWKRGAQIVSIAGLHSKVYVFDKNAVIGSANLSKGSEKRTEAALVTDQPSVVSSARMLIEQLRRMGNTVDEAFIARISKLPVTKSFPESGDGKQKPIPDTTPRTWLVGLKRAKQKVAEAAVAEEGMEEAEKLVSQDDSEVSWIRFRGNSQFRRNAKEGDVVVCIWTPDGKGNLPYAVYHHAPILLRKDDEAHDVTFLYVEEYPDAEETTLTWKRFQKLYSQVGIPGKLSQWAFRELARHHSDALHDLWFN